MTKRYYFDVEDSDLIQILNLHEEKETLSVIINTLLDENKDELLESIKDEIEEKSKLYNNLNKTLKKKA